MKNPVEVNNSTVLQAQKRTSEKAIERSIGQVKRPVWSGRVSEQCKQKRERTNEWPNSNVPISRGSVDEFGIHVHRTPHLDVWSFCWLFGYVFTILAFPGGFCITASG